MQRLGTRANMEMDQARWDYFCDYGKEVFGKQDDHLTQLMDEAVALDFPDVAVSPDVGRFLKMLVMMGSRLGLRESGLLYKLTSAALSA